MSMLFLTPNFTVVLKSIVNNENVKMSQKKKKSKHCIPAGRKQIITTVKDYIIFATVNFLKEIASLHVSENLPQPCFPSLI